MEKPSIPYLNDPEFSSRFWEKVDIQTRDQCWEWKASFRRDFYGQITHKGKNYSAHRVAFELTFGKVMAETLRHSCDNPRCCNPYHLTPGSHAANMRDMVSRGRHGARNRARNSMGRFISLDPLDSP